MPFRILIVDDNPLVRNLLRKSLESQADWQVCGEAADGKEGIEKAQAMSPNLIILDLSMPVVNGIEAAKILSHQMPNVALIMFTSFSTPSLEQMALAAGVDKVISKSDSLTDLIECARSLASNAA